MASLESDVRRSIRRATLSGSPHVRASLAASSRGQSAKARRRASTASGVKVGPMLLIRCCSTGDLGFLLSLPALHRQQQGNSCITALAPEF